MNYDASASGQGFGLGLGLAFPLQQSHDPRQLGESDGNASEICVASITRTPNWGGRPRPGSVIYCVQRLEPDTLQSEAREIYGAAAAASRENPEPQPEPEPSELQLSAQQSRRVIVVLSGIRDRTDRSVRPKPGKINEAN